MTAIARATGPAQLPWQPRAGESAAEVLEFFAWRLGLLPLNPELADRYDWARRADWLDRIESTPQTAPELLRDGTAYALTAGFIAQRERAIHAAADPEWARDNITTAEWLALVAKADEITLPDPGREIDWERLLVEGIITRDELELRVAADELDRRLGL